MSIGENLGRFGIFKNRANCCSRVLDDKQLVRLREAIKGSVFDTADGLGFQRCKTLVEVASSISPQLFDCFCIGFSHRPNDYAGESSSK